MCETHRERKEAGGSIALHYWSQESRSKRNHVLVCFSAFHCHASCTRRPTSVERWVTTRKDNACKINLRPPHSNAAQKTKMYTLQYERLVGRLYERKCSQSGLEGTRTNAHWLKPTTNQTHWAESAGQGQVLGRVGEGEKANRISSRRVALRRLAVWRMSPPSLFPYNQW